MPLKNYTTEVPAMKSIGQIQGNLVSHGARRIEIIYSDNGEPTSVAFIVPTPQGDTPFRLPANIAAVARVLEKQLTSSRYRYSSAEVKAERQKKMLEQASRVAWRIIKDWVDAQLAIIETEMVTLEQVFLPYMIFKDDKTLYDVMVEKRFMLTDGRSQ